jgi:6-pyruvoyltetrahydropterin/6-carboxytetrahydropterin synthase
VKVTCRYRFSASHRLDSPALSAEQNRELYGKCNNPYGHGHNYTLDVTVAGPLDRSGQVVNREELDTLVRGHVVSALDHKNLNLDVPVFAGGVPTTENLASFIEGVLREHWNLKAKLDRIRIYETDRNTFELEAVQR